MSVAHEISVTGRPAQQGSKKHVGGGRMVEMAKRLPAWRKAVVAAAKESHGPEWEPLDGALVVGLTVYLPRPKGTKYPDYPAGPPDTDKLQRAIGDALTQAGTIADDARIVTWHAHKRWAVGCEPGATIRVETL
ncbi:MAG TPA: RusA family crossover junction endodeoxyribonuclease [Arthrobacter sp.]